MTLTLPMFNAAAVLAILSVAAICDLRSQTIPGILTFGMLGMGLAISTLIENSLMASLLAASVGVAFAGVFVLLGWVREGDAMVLAVIGGWTNWHFVIAVAAWTAIAGAPLALVFAAHRGFPKRWWRMWFPYTPAIAVGASIAVFVA